MNTRGNEPALALPGDTPVEYAEAVRVFFSHASPRLLVLAVLLSVAARIGLGAWSPVDVLIPLVIALSWPLLEWLIHVHLLHFRPRRILGIHIDPMNARRHREHHLDPWLFQRAFIPLPGLLLALAKLGIVAALSPWPATWTALATITLLGLHYEWVHYLSHVRYCPQIKHYRELVSSHRRHHFKSEKHWLGVSMTSGDLIMGTAPDPAEVERSATVRRLHADMLT